MKVQIKEASDWQKLREQGLETVVDPMVFRCGELFLKGVSDTETPDNTWNLLTANLHAIQIFFDSLILNEKLPVFNYGDTFDMGLNFDQRVLTRINDYGETLFDVDVEYQRYHEVKDAALEELKKVYEGPAKIKQSMANEVISELSAAEYKWSPDTGELQHVHSEDERQLAAFLLGGLIFGGYAQLMDGEHLLQPKRSRLFLAVSLGAKSSGHQLEDILFADLKQRANIACEDLPWTPTFFPYLLSKAETPMELLKQVAKLRQSSEVVDYRAWMGEVMQEWKRDGRIRVKREKEVRAIAKRVDRALGQVPSMPKVEVKATVALAVPLAVDFTPAVERLWGWALASLPGNRYRKLLTRAVVADREYPILERRIKTVWNAG